MSFKIAVMVIAFFSFKQSDPWQQDQLIEPKDLVTEIEISILKDPLIIKCKSWRFDKKFNNHKLLNLPHNIKMDWIDKGYPTNN